MIEVGGLLDEARANLKTGFWTDLQRKVAGDYDQLHDCGGDLLDVVAGEALQVVNEVLGKIGTTILLSLRVRTAWMSIYVTKKA